jgi:hypothetical protein
MVSQKEAAMNQMAGASVAGDRGVEAAGQGRPVRILGLDVQNADGLGNRDHSVELGTIPLPVKASAAPTLGAYDARRLRSQREIIRDVMLSAAECDTWLTLGELRALTRYGEASISARLRHLRKSEHGGYEVVKRHREGVLQGRPGIDGRGECIWEYQITRAGAAAPEATASA